MRKKQKLDDLFYIDDEPVRGIDSSRFFDGSSVCLHDVSISQCDDTRCAEEWEFRCAVRDNPGKPVDQILRDLSRRVR